MKDASTFRSILSDIACLLEEGREKQFADAVRTALASSDKAVAEFLTSNALWGGSGSIADSAFVGNQSFDGFDTLAARAARFKALMIRLGRLQMDARRTNVRTST
jgi:hypothetical protein